MRGIFPLPQTIQRIARARLQRGTSIVEILIALLVISLGLLGIAGLSAATFGYNKAAQVRLTGLSLVNDYADRARLNVYGYDLGKYAIALADVPAASAVTEAKDAMKAGETASLTAAENVAAYDRQLFQRTVASRLPQGRAVVASNPTVNARNLDVWLLWQEPATSTGNRLFGAGQVNCPSDLTPANKAIYNCMYFKVGL